jgi:ATP-dependent DNA helicase PIF1
MPRGATLHSWAGVGLAKDSPEQVLHTVKNSKAAKNWRNTKLLVVDEASMMSKRLFDLLEYIGQRIRRNEAPFGGLQLALCGDFFQLPPVSRGSAGDDSRYCFESEKWGLAVNACIELTHVYRQRDASFLQLLNQVRFNELRPEGQKLLESLNRPLQMKEGIKPTRLYSQNKSVDDINMKELAALPGEAHQFRATDTAACTEQLNKLTLFPEVLVLKVGAQVMLLKNLPGGQLVNGSRGVVESFAVDNTPVVRWINGMTTSVSVEDSKHEVGPRTLVRHQYPLKLCWAMTVHKSQGMSIDYLEVDLATVFEKGQAYVALSRARTLEGLRVVAFDPSRFWTDGRAVEFYRTNVKKVEEFMDKHLGTTAEAGA